MNREMKVYMIHITPEIFYQVYSNIDVLSIVELEEIALIRNINVKKESLVSKVMKRFFLSFYCNWTITPHEWQFDISRNKKPFLSNNYQHMGIQFNVSHCDDVFAIAISKSSGVGIDIEPYSFSIDDNLAKTVFSPNEIFESSKLGPIEKQNNYLRLWTLKEAYSKYLGLGINIDFKTINVLRTSHEYFPILSNSTVPEIFMHNSTISFQETNYSLSVARRRSQSENNDPEIIHFDSLEILNLLSPQYI